MLEEQPRSRRRRRPPPSAKEGLLEEVGEMTAFGARAMAGLAGAPRYFAEISRQVSILITGSVFIIAALEALIGFSVINFGYYFLKAVGATDYTGVIAGVITPRGTTPQMFGYIFAAKVGCGMVSEIGAMQINEEIAAYEAEGIDPMRYVVGTRVAAALLFLPIIAPIALLAGLFGTYVSAVPVLHGLSSAEFLRYAWGSQGLEDNLLACGCMALEAVVIVVVSCFYGMRARGGPAQVGTYSARSLVINLVLVQMIVPAYLALFYGTNAKLGIGG